MSSEPQAAKDAVLRFAADYGRDALIARARGLAANNPLKWHAETLRETDKFRCTVLAIDPNEAIPLHDHPGAWGTLLVLHGSVLHHQFTVVGQDRGAWVLRRARAARELLRPSTLTSFSADFGNAQSFVAGDEGCILLGISLRSSQPSYWYSPLNDIASATVVAFRSERQGL